MRALGLVFDLEVTVPAGAGAINTIAVRTNWPAKAGLGPHDEVPMRVAVDPGFKAVVDQPDYRVTDWLALGTASTPSASSTCVNAIHQMGQLADTWTRRPSRRRGVEVPALLESGLSVICGDLGDVLKATAGTAAPGRGRHRPVARRRAAVAAAAAVRRGHHRSATAATSRTTPRPASTRCTTARSGAPTGSRGTRP